MPAAYKTYCLYYSQRKYSDYAQHHAMFTYFRFIKDLTKKNKCVYIFFFLDVLQAL